MENFEKKYRELGYKNICGIDEVGRGCLFGDVVAAAVIMPSDKIIEGITDSKKLSEKKRNYYYDLILESALAIGIGRKPADLVDKINIKNATHRAMEEAVKNMLDKNSELVRPDLLLIDAEKIDLDIDQVALIKGDLNCYSIACASIVAKVFRDRLCLKWEEQYPGYGIAKHKGYGTKAHMDALREKGPSPLHRRTFLKNLLNEK
ncbi:ribonuclease HII [Clostridiales bacterium KA00134]|nr:ribonuclease HII [Clostridiales bacterium KA00134]